MSPATGTSTPSSTHTGINNSATSPGGGGGVGVSLLNRKYLCSAPRPDQFDELSDRVVSSQIKRLFGGAGGDDGSVATTTNNKNKKEHVRTMIIRTMERLQRMHHLKPRIGPGRKSNAEHALAFYEYLLEYLAAKEEEEDNASPSDDDNDDDDEETDRKNPSELIVHENACHVCCEAISQPERRSRLILLCDTCQLVFHSHCYRPKLFVSSPSTTTTINNTTDQCTPHEGSFRCSYCVLADSKKNSKERRQAAAAVRLMARLRQQYKRRKQQQQQPDANQEEKKHHHHTPVKQEQEETTTTTTPVELDGEEHKQEQDNHEDAQSVSSSKIHKRPLSPSSDHHTTTTAAEGKKPTGRCSKRPRRQPTLFDPQASSPASRWQTDELQEWKMKQHEEEIHAALKADKQHNHHPDHRTDDDDDDDKQSNVDTDHDEEENMHKHETKTKRSIDNNSTKADETPSVVALRSGKRDNDSVWCNFCRDDPEIAICVFCACRNCFGKHHESKLLLCDKCDEEYHSFCLDPPLKSLPPKSQPWYCPSCSKDCSNTASGDPVRTSARKRESVPSSAASPSTSVHSPRSLRNHPSSTTHHATNTSPARTANATDSVVPKRVSARQVERKANAASPEKTAPPPRPPTPPPPPQPLQPAETSAASASKKKGTGRPRGRPPKNQNKNAADNIPRNTQKTAPVPSVAMFQGPRKRGRPPKAETLARRAQDAVENAARKADARNKSKGGSSSSGGGRDAKSATSSSKGKVSAVQKLSSSSPSSQKATAAGTVSIVVPIATSVPVAVSRSGRTVKRLKPFEEIAEGQQQHLKAPLRSVVTVVPPSSTIVGNVPLAATAVEPTRAAVEMMPSSQLPSAVLVNTAAPIPSSSDPSEKQVSFSQSSFLQLTQQLAPSTLQQPTGIPLTFPIKTPTAAVVGVAPTIPTVAHESAGSLISMGEVALDPEAQGTTSTISAAAAAPKLHITPSGYSTTKVPRRKPGARECMQISRRFGVKEIPQEYMDILLDYCTRGKVEHLIRMRERLDDHSRFLELQLAGLEALVKDRGESNVTVPLAPPSPGRTREGEKS